MLKDIKIRFILILLSLIAILFPIMNWKYKETEQRNKKLTYEMNKAYQTSEYVQYSFRLIRESNFYRKDSLWISPERELHSNNPSIENALRSIYSDQEKWDSIYFQVVKDKLPEYYIIYQEATKTFITP